VKSFFIGVGLFVVFVVFAPLTTMWVIGERYQGRVGVKFWYRHGYFDEQPTGAGACLVTFTVLGFMVWPILLIKACQ